MSRDDEVWLRWCGVLGAELDALLRALRSGDSLKVERAQLSAEATLTDYHVWLER